MADTKRLPPSNDDRWEWQRQAACRSMENSDFFPPEGERGPPRARREAEAKRVCHECPVQLQCRRHALTAREPHGVWGGLTQSEREAILLNRRQDTDTVRGTNDQSPAPREVLLPRSCRTDTW